MSHTTPNDRWAKAYNAGAAAGYKQAEARILELEEQAERCECDKHDWEQAEARIRELEARLAEIRALHRETSRNLCFVAAVNQAEAWEKAAAEEEARAQQAEARLEAVKALCDREIASDYAEYATVLAQDVLRAAEGKP